MKLKSKLIATIVSICAAIAVMGVGVWAATSSFKVSVTNNVNINFAALNGNAKVTAYRSLDSAIDTNDIATANSSVTIADIEDVYDDDSNSKEFAVSATNFADYVNFLTGTYVTMEKEVTAAAVAYLVEFNNTDTSQNVNITLAGTTFDHGYTGGTGFALNAVAYARVGGTGAWTQVADGTYKAGTAAKIEVLFVVTYANPNLASVTGTEKSWTPSVTFTPGDSGSALNGSTTIDAGILNAGKLVATTAE